MSIAIALALTLLAQGPSPSSEAPSPMRLPVSLTHIREALAKQTWLQITVPPEQPTYRLEIREHPFFKEKPYKWDFGGGGYAPRYPVQQGTPSSTPPLFTIRLWHSDAH
jgi:hypothetical protein